MRNASARKPRIDEKKHWKSSHQVTRRYKFTCASHDPVYGHPPPFTFLKP